MERIFAAHKLENGDIQTIADHSSGTAKLASDFAIDIAKPAAYYLGMMHDIGKYRDGFQARIMGSSHIPCEHACCGAQEIFRIAKSGKGEFAAIAPMLEYCVSGHHSGLQNGKATQNHAEGTLCDSLARDTSDIDKYKCFFSDIQPPSDESVRPLFGAIYCPSSSQETVERYSFFTRYLFSCLTDADFIDTEAFCNKSVNRGINGDFSAALERVDSLLAGFSVEGNVRRARKSLQSQVFGNAADAPISILNMPTGSGKTLCSIRYALQRAVGMSKKRIIYVLPFTSIIEQTAAVFERCFGDVLPILQHHSNYHIDDANTDAEILRRTTENWDAPLIITTNVQFFQSLYHNRSSKLRKMHNMADSIIVFDEVHMMPIEYLQPCLRAVGYITSFLNTEAVFMSATMPDFSSYLREYSGVQEVHNLITDASDFSCFSNCEYVNIGQCTDEALLKRCEQFSSALVVVNSRKKARELYNACTAENKFCLSTYMTPLHRFAVIDKIRSLLGKETIVVFSTSLIEAGVDLDFEAVFREIAGLDNIIQTAGRCNREGKRDNGYAHIFESAEGISQSVALKANITRKLIEDYDDITSTECISEYYKRLYAANRDTISNNTICSDVVTIDSIPFRDYAESFNFIGSDTINVVIPCAENEALIAKLRYCKALPKSLSKYCATLYRYEAERLLQSGVISDEGGVYVLRIDEYYDEYGTGLNPDYIPNMIL